MTITDADLDEAINDLRDRFNPYLTDYAIERCLPDGGLREAFITRKARERQPKAAMRPTVRTRQSAAGRPGGVATARALDLSIKFGADELQRMAEHRALLRRTLEGASEVDRSRATRSITTLGQLLGDKKAGAPSLGAWLHTQCGRDDTVGTFAREFTELTTALTMHTADEIRTYMATIGLNARGRAALELAEAEYVEALGRRRPRVPRQKPAMVDPDVPHVLYRFFDSSGTLLYVGITAKPPARWKAHGKQKTWWLKVASITLEHFDTREALAAAEKQAIKGERPIYNVTHNRNAGVVARDGEFAEWLRSRRHEIGPVGDLAADVLRDPEWPDEGSHETYRDYLYLERSACSEALEAFDAAWAKFVRTRRRAGAT